MVLLLHQNQKSITKKGLACTYYTTFSENSKMNLPIHEKAMNAEHGLSKRSLRSLFHLPRLKLRTCFDAFKLFWVYRHREKTLLYVHGFTQDLLATALERFMEDDSRTFNK